jgi:hypothetical protein
MNQKGRKLQPKLHLDMSFGEALARFTQTDSAELNEAQSMRDDSFTVHIPRISPKNFEAFRRVTKDKIGSTYKKWLEGHNERISHYTESAKIIEVDIDPDDFAEFCDRETKSPDFNSLQEFAVYLGKPKR